MLTIIKCPFCDKDFELNKVLDRDLREQILATLKEEHQKNVEEARQKAIEETKRKVDEDNVKRLEEVRKQAYNEAASRINDKYITDYQFMKQQLEEKESKVNEYRSQELKLRREKAKIEEEKKDFEVTIQRRIDDEKKKAEQLLLDKVGREYKLKLAEKDLHIEGMTKTIEELQRKSNITSQQIQGEVLELDVQRRLGESFPDDEIIEIEKFKNGSDIRQHVKSRKGLICGKIIWECKRTNTFKSDFVTKLKEDILREEADFGIIVTTTLPKQAIQGIAQIDGIWVCSQAVVEYLGILLREPLINMAREKWINENKGNKGDQLIGYFNSAPFAQQARELGEALFAQRAQINRERNVYTKMWTDRETQIDRQTKSIAKILSSIQGYVGSGMQQIDAFELLSLENGQK